MPGSNWSLTPELSSNTGHLNTVEPAHDGSPAVLHALLSLWHLLNARDPLGSPLPQLAPLLPQQVLSRGLPATCWQTFLELPAACQTSSFNNLVLKFYMSKHAISSLNLHLLLSQIPGGDPTIYPMVTQSENCQINLDPSSPLNSTD